MSDIDSMISVQRLRAKEKEGEEARRWKISRGLKKSTVSIFLPI